jgi:hypothetical protein
LNSAPKEFALSFRSNGYPETGFEEVERITSMPTTEQPVVAVIRSAAETLSLNSMRRMISLQDVFTAFLSSARYSLRTELEFSMLDSLNFKEELWWRLA